MITSGAFIKKHGLRSQGSVQTSAKQLAQKRDYYTGKELLLGL
jgi:hypothetical protein